MIGRKINNYEVVSLLGEGGMGSVYVAEHPVLGRRVAVKVLKREFAEDKGLVARFMNEARAASAIRQPNIIEIFDVGILPDGVPYLMMQLLEGESLAGRLHRDKRLPVEDALPIAIQAATALAAAHAKQIVHRDLKPDNLFLVPDEDAPRGQRVVVLDFGIAKLRGELSAGSVQTHTGSVMGTPPYMSPEQCRGLIDEIDHRTDIYALGIILHEMLTGAPPFVSAGFGDLLIMHITRPPPPLRSLDASLPPGIESIVLRALAKERDMRFESMAELKSALRGPPGKPIVTAPYRERGLSPESGDPARPRTISTLSKSTGEMLAADPEQLQPTVPMRRARRKLAAGALAVVGVAATIFLGTSLAPSKRAMVSDAAPAAIQAAAAVPSPAATPRSASALVTVPAPPKPPPPVAPPPPATPAAIPPAMETVVRSSKHATPSRTSRAKSRESVRPLLVSAPPSGPSAPTTAPAAVAPPPGKPTPKLSADKW